MKPRFEKHDNQLFRMLEEPEPLTLVAAFPCVVTRREDGDIGRYTKWHCSGLIGEQLVVKEIIDGKVVFEDAIWTLCKLPYLYFEIIGYPVVEGSHWWALYQMIQGAYVIHRSSAINECVRLHGELIYSDYHGSAFCNKNDFINVACKDGWQIYKESESPVDPKERPLRNLIIQAKEEGKNIRLFYQNLIFTPNALTDLLANNMFRWWYIGNWELTDEEQNYYPQIKLVSSEPETAKEQFEVGDWLEFIDAGGRKSQGKYLSNADGNAIIVLDTASNMRVVVHTTKIIRKLSPIDVEVDFGFAKGRILSRTSGDVKVLNNKSVVIASIIVSEITNPTTRSLVESLLEAMQKEEK